MDIDIADNFPFNCVEEDEWYTEIEDKTQYDWFGFELGILIEGKKINILPLLVKLISEHQDILNADQIHNLRDDHQFYLQLPDKRYMAVEAKRIKDILFVLVELYDNKLTNGKMKVGAFQAAQLLGLQQALNARWMGGDKLRFLIMIQQHNMKEENVLYPMCDQHLTDDASSLLERIGSALHQA